MEVSPDLVQLETELRTEDLPSLKRRQAKNRRDATRNERFLKNWASKDINGLDPGAVEYHLENIKANISVAEILQDTILSHLKKEDEEKEMITMLITAGYWQLVWACPIPSQQHECTGNVNWHKLLLG